MNFLEKMKSRYTVKKYNPQGTISEEQIQQLKEILHLSPSSINSQPWNFVLYRIRKQKTAWRSLLF
jgi:nitroreductase/dihydropteridine reductase